MQSLRRNKVADMDGNKSECVEYLQNARRISAQVFGESSDETCRIVAKLESLAAT